MKGILTTMLLLLLNQFVIAQNKDFNNYYNRRFHFGAKAGANMTKIDGRGFSEGFRYGFHAGGFVQVKLVGRVSLQGEVLFSQMVADTAKDLSEVVDYIRFSESRERLRLNYLDIPVVLNLGIDKVGAFKLQVGAQYGILLNKSQTLLQNGENAFKSGQFSVLGGFMWQLPFVHFGGRYIIGLDNLNQVTDKASWKSQTGQIYIGFTI